MQSDIFIVEDHPLMREMLTELINEASDLRVCGSATYGDGVVAQIVASAPDVVLLDISLSRTSGPDLVKKLCGELPDVRCVVLSGDGDSAFARRLFEAGVHGLVLKGNPDEILDALRKVASGAEYRSSSIRDR